MVARLCFHLQVQLGENWLPKLIQVVGRIHFLIAVELRASVSCWQLVEVCPQQLVVTPSSVPRVLPQQEVEIMGCRILLSS